MATTTRTYPFELVTGRRPQLGIHPALVLNHTIAIDGTEQQRKDSVTNAYKAVIDLPVPMTYRRRFDRWNGWTRRRENLSTPGFTRFEVTTKGRLIVGMGDESILENSITLSWVDGVPVIPGSAIKGLVGAVARSGWFTVEDDRELCDEERNVLTGTVEAASFFTFHDAWYVPGGDRDRPLRLDVMTPHHQNYNSSRGAKDPRDSDDPIPIHFLATRGTFLFAIQGPNAAWTHLARQVLVFGLEHLGIGAKTSSGYGRFTPPADAGPIRYETEGVIARARQLSQATFESDGIALAYEIADLAGGLHEAAARAFAQRTRDIGREGWLRDQDDWALFEEYLEPAFAALHGG
jgi:CRISPR-associated protein Cmr6